MQGFFFWLGVPGVQYYQILLSLHTLLLVTFGWRPKDFERRIERHAHKVIFAVAFILAIIPIFFEGYNPECSTCLPAPLPIWCGDWIFWGDDETECLRGNPTLSTSYYTIYLTNLSTMGVFCTGSMIQVYWSVRRQENRNARYAGHTFTQEERRNAHHERSRRIRRTMILYTFGFYFCWVVPSFLIHFAEQGKPAIIMSYVLLPGQGFFNLIIFLAPKCAKYQKNHPGTRLIMAYVYVIFGKACTPCSRCFEWILQTDMVHSLRRRRSSHRIQSPFRMSGSRRPNNVTEQTQTMEWLDEDSIGFQDFNEEPKNYPAGNENEEPIAQTAHEEHGPDGENDSPVEIELDNEGDNWPRSDSVVRFAEEILPIEGNDDIGQQDGDDDVIEPKE